METTDKKNILNEFFNIENEALRQSLESIMTVQVFRIGENIVEAGKKQKYIYFNMTGIFREYYIDQNDKEITEFFGMKRGASVNSWNALDGESKIGIQAITKVTVIAFPVAEINELAQRFPEIYIFCCQLLKQRLDWNWKLKKIHYQLTAMEKYQWFLEEFPDLEYYVRSKDIASFLQFSSVSLSRIRKEIWENKQT